MEDVYNHIINYGNGGNGIMSADAGQGFIGKIDYNGFDDAWRAFWNVGIKHIGDVTDYFKSRPEKQQECYKVVTESYQEMSKQSDNSNEIIRNMVIKFAPDTEKPENLYHISYILVHFFANCSIFKKNI